MTHLVTLCATLGPTPSLSEKMNKNPFQFSTMQLLAGKSISSFYITYLILFNHHSSIKLVLNPPFLESLFLGLTYIDQHLMQNVGVIVQKKNCAGYKVTKEDKQRG